MCDCIKQTLIQRNTSFYFHCPSIISLPNLSLIVSQRTHAHKHRSDDVIYHSALTKVALFVITLRLIQ